MAPAAVATLAAAVEVPDRAGKIDLGTCVRFSPAGGWSRARMTQDAVVIEVVPPGCGVLSGGVIYPRPWGSSRSGVVRYVLQWRRGRTVRTPAELVIVSL